MRFNELLFAGAFAASASASIIRRAAVSKDLPSGWSYQGCYTDNVPSRVLTGASYADGSGMTEQSCISFCSQRGFSFAGVEYAQECYCDYQLANASTLQPDGDCSMTCSGDSTEACGAGNRLTVFSNGGGPPVTNPGPDGWESLGCYTDSGSKTLVNYPSKQQDSSSMTVATCTSACRASGYTYAGLEYGGECYCGFWISNEGAPAPIADCGMTCNGNRSEFCGGPNRLDLYQLPNETYPATSNLPAGWEALGCWTDSVQNRTLPTGEPVPGGYTNMTIENCLQACQSNGFALAGVEYSQECFCANQVSNGGVCAADPQTCNMPCRGNTDEICGGSNRLNMFQYGAGSVSPCSGTSGSSTSSTAISSTATSSIATSSTDTSVTSTPTSTSSPLSSTSTIPTTSTESTSTTTPFTTSTTTVPTSTSSPTSSTSALPTTSTDSTSTTTPLTTSTTSTTSPSSTTTPTSTTPVTTPTTSTVSTTSTTSTTTTTSPTTTSVPTTVFPTTSTTVVTPSSTTSTTSACTPTSTSATSFGNVINGGFELGMLPWIGTTNQGSAQISVVSDGTAFAGCQQLVILPTSSPGTLRQVTISQALTPVLVPGRVYTLTMYQGRNSSASTASNPSIAIRFGATTVTVGPSCNGATCTLRGQAGSVYQRIVVPFVAPTVSTPLSLVFTWTDSNANAPILLDEISVK